MRPLPTPVQGTRYPIIKSYVKSRNRPRCRPAECNCNARLKQWKGPPIYRRPNRDQRDDYWSHAGLVLA